MSDIISIEKATKRGKMPLIAHADIHYITDKKHVLYDERLELPIDLDFVEDIKANGIIEPVILFKDGSTFFLLCGYQRVKTVVYISEKFGIEVGIPFRVVEGDTLRLLAIKFSENAQRQDVPPCQTARNAKRLLDQHMPEKEVCSTLRLGSVENLRLQLELNKLDPKIQALVDSGKLSKTFAARELSKLPQSVEAAKIETGKGGGEVVLTQVEAYNKMSAEGTLKGAAAVEEVRRIRTGGKKDGDGTPAGKPMRRRPVLERFAKKLKAIGTKDAELASAVIKWIFGNDKALAEYSKLFTAADEALEAPPKPKKKTEEK